MWRKRLIAPTAGPGPERLQTHGGTEPLPVHPQHSCLTENITLKHIRLASGISIFHDHKGSVPQKNEAPYMCMQQLPPLA